MECHYTICRYCCVNSCMMRKPVFAVDCRGMVFYGSFEPEVNRIEKNLPGM